MTHVRVRPGGNLSQRPGHLFTGQNSGHQAIAWAYQKGARKIVLVGYDMQHTGGRTHWHGDHPRGLTNAQGIEGWRRWFEPLAKDLALLGVEVINCSEETALTCFKRGNLHDCL